MNSLKRIWMRRRLILCVLRELSEKKEQSEALLEQKMERWVYLSDLAERIELKKIVKIN